MGNKPVSIIFFVMLLLLGQIGTATGEETLTFGRFGKVWTYRGSPAPSRVVLFISGDGGWNLGVVDMAKSLASLDALVAGIDIVHYLKEIGAAKEPCSYCAADFEVLSQYVQKTYQFPKYVTPVLVGYSSGATLAYATLVQAPAGTFEGAISLGFCPDLPLVKPLCRGTGLEWQTGAKGKGYRFLPAPSLQTPWIAFQGTVDQVCDPVATDAFVKQVGNGKIILLPKVGHGFSVQRNWLPQFKEAFAQITANKPHAAPLPDAVKRVHDAPNRAEKAYKGGCVTGSSQKWHHLGHPRGFGVDGPAQSPLDVVRTGNPPFHGFRHFRGVFASGCA